MGIFEAVMGITAAGFKPPKFKFIVGSAQSKLPQEEVSITV
jgi:hypothetical protein